MIRRSLALLLAGLLALAVAGCGGTAAPTGEAAPHTHSSLPAGDGIKASYVGYTLADLKVPTKVGVPGRVSFHIESYTGKPVTSFATDLTKEMHLYVVRTDLSVYRHVHPTMAADGTWTGNLTLPVAGRYRFVTEFIATDDSDNGGDTLLLGTERTIGGPGKDVPVPAATTSATSDGVTVTVQQVPTTGYEHQMSLGFTKDGSPASLGTYLGVYSHISAFDVKTGVLVHMHPLGAPEPQGDQTVLTFHTGFNDPGSYRMFVQVRISGVVRTIPITVAVTGPAAPEL